MLNEESCPSITNFSAGLQKVNQERGNNHSFFAADSQIGRKLIAQQLSFLGGASGGLHQDTRIEDPGEV